VKKLLAITIAIIAILSMAVPAMAVDPIDTHVTLGGGGGGANDAPYMIALGITPDEIVGDGVQVYPEPAVPNPAIPLFPPTDPNEDGWKMVCFYVEVGSSSYDQNHNSINSVIIDVYYPNAAALANYPLYIPRAELRKFEINAFRAGGTGPWMASSTFDYSDNYSDGTMGVAPAVSVRELTGPGDASDIVDVNADDILGPPPDVNWQTFLNTADKIVYGTADPAIPLSYDETSAFQEYQDDEALVLEICGWMWFHQPGLNYRVEAKAQSDSGMGSDILVHQIKYQKVTGLYLDFETVNFGTVTPGVWANADGDADLRTPNRTTIWNNGNEDAQVYIDATKMVKGYNTATGTPAGIIAHTDYDNLAKTIKDFDVALYYADASGASVQVGKIVYEGVVDLAEWLGPDNLIISHVPPGPYFPFVEINTTGQDTAVRLQACRPAKIVFSVEPLLGDEAAGSQYGGYVTLSVAPYAGVQPQVN
jgi:hypothetical protein